MVLSAEELHKDTHSCPMQLVLKHDEASSGTGTPGGEEGGLTPLQANTKPYMTYVPKMLLMPLYVNSLPFMSQLLAVGPKDVCEVGRMVASRLSQPN